MREADTRRGCGAVVWRRPGAPMALGIVLIIIGTIFLLESLGITDRGIRELWPLILIGIGLLILYERGRRWYRRR